MTTTELDLPTIELISDLPGFPGLRKFVLVQFDGNGLLFDFQSLDQADVRFVVMPSVAFFPDYAPEIESDVISKLGIRAADEAWLLLIVTVGVDLKDSTVNLRAPLIVNLNTRAASQVVLADDRLSLRQPLRSD
ncbi:MAG TPA: flagellar assembly protein FliW [Candidatus Nanopelagicaceae bacterium]|nr:flagellar assembly protein FliW [Candidatus Nanopelagicaceae bacterium]